MVTMCYINRLQQQIDGSLNFVGVEVAAVKCDRKKNVLPREDSSKAAKDSFSPTWPADHQQSDSAGSVHCDAHLPAAAPSYS